MYTLIGAANTRSHRVLWGLEELGVPYIHKPDGPRSAAALALNPSGKVPILLEGEAVLTDSTAILTYLSDKHGALTHPAGSLARAHQDAMTQMVLDELDSVLWMAAKHTFVLPEHLRLPAIKDSLRWEFGRTMARLDKQLTGPFATGDAFTITDIILAECLGWAVGAKFAIEQENLRSYLARMRARPAFVRLKEQ